MTTRDDIVIVGAGIIGLSLAFELLSRELPVRVLTAPDRHGSATFAAAGMLAPVSEADVQHPELVPLAVDSLDRYPDFLRRVEAVSGLDCGHRGEGTLWLALQRDHRAELEHLLDFMADRGFTAEALDARSLRRLEPAITPRVVAGCRIPGDHQVDPRALHQALWRAVEALGGRIEQATVVGSSTEAGRLQGLWLRPDHAASASAIASASAAAFAAASPVSGGDAELLPCAQAVLANGAWLGQDFDGELPACGMRPVWGQVLRLRGEPLIDHVIRTPDVYLVPRRDGRLLVGASSEERGFDHRVHAGATYELLRHAIAALPDCAELELEEVSVGFRPASRDHLPVIGATAVSGLYLCGGHFRNGILLAPGTAAALASALAGEQSAPNLAPFSPQRFESAA